MYEKYNKTMRAMHEKSGDDNNVCLDKLIYTYKVRTGEVKSEGADVYPEIPSTFDWDEFGKDYKQLIL